MLIAQNWDPEQPTPELADIWRSTASLIYAAERVKADGGHQFESERELDKMLTTYLTKYREIKALRKLRKEGDTFGTPEARAAWNAARTDPKNRDFIIWDRLHTRVKGLGERLDRMETSGLGIDTKALDKQFTQLVKDVQRTLAK